MRCVAAFLIAIAAVGPVSADESVLARISAVEVGDINGDGRPDAAMLIAPDEEATDQDHALSISFGEDIEDVVKLTVYVPDFVWGGTGGLVGNRATLSINERGSLLVQSKNIAVGRSRWEETITLAWRDREVVVAGYTYGFYDTLDNDRYGSCDLNLLTGNGVRITGDQTDRITSDLVRVPVAEWRARAGDNPCEF